ncbi:Uncharacterized conserved protein YdgA, DUF945 family [Pseudomonas sp. NFACC32-1]|uniref:YdgA family protein n=1 Tax=Pseudomonas TaxID=286 RepID=UPI0008767DB3|nr:MULTISPECIES: YdgA family protein [Pseudomonas]MDB6446653.1 YdgA family protein [Pseudomonas sp. 21TX0197]MDT8907901.1 YdgA family protein [Pseudomonas prosekii]NHN70771.1 YdgA family protein [Pseudomonas fluorescens]ROO43003.1 hypothetical protein BIV08_08050 [Pseudomonas sp. AF76]SCX72307.1 Uncharacterized conserved protein YdgA, DUF945 family [Pseudomonas sp. NFACC32-1]
MNKSASVLLGIVVVVGAISAGGAWYTGTKLEGVLQNAIADSNKQMAIALTGSNSSSSIELVSLERGIFSSTARYRLKGEGEMFGGEAVELQLVDNIEHGPLPFSRLMTLKWLPVMATSHTEIERNPLTDKWFAAAKDKSPVKGVFNLGYDQSVNGTLELLPLDTKLDEQSHLIFSGLKFDLAASAQAEKIKLDGYMDNLKLTTVAEDQSPVQVELNGLTLASNLSKSSYGYYLGENALILSNTKAIFGEQKSVVGLKNLEMKNSSTESGTNASGRADYKIGELSFNEKAIGSAHMALSLKNLDVPATMSLMQLYQTKLQPYEKAAAEAAEAGEPAPELNLTEAEEKQVKADLEKILAGSPQVAVEKLAFSTPNGESSASLVINLAKPQSMDLPPDELGRQLLALLELNVKVSKPMLADLATVQAQMEGQTDAKLIADQATATSDMFSAMAVGTQLATLEGNDVVTRLRYANDQVDFNGQKMTVEQFTTFVMNQVGGGVAVQ